MCVLSQTDPSKGKYASYGTYKRAAEPEPAPEAVPEPAEEEKRDGYGSYSPYGKVGYRDGQAVASHC